MPPSKKQFCKRGHERTPDNIVARDTCRQCARIATDKWRELNKEKSRQIANIASVKWQKKNPEKLKLIGKRNSLKKLYDLSLETYEQMVQTQENKCAICSKEMNPPHVDHDHKTGRVRQLLCHRCNFGLGNFDDDMERMGSALSYLKKWQEEQANAVAA